MLARRTSGRAITLNQKLKIYAAATALSSLGLFCAPANAQVTSQSVEADQEAPAQAAGVDGDAELIFLDTIIVLGEKFARDLFTTYTSVEVVTADEIENFNYNTLGEALNRSPNIRAFETGTGDSNFVVRGQNAEGATQPSRSNPAVSVIVDGAEQGIEATRRGTRGIWDVEQVEVLRGPQSTLQGRNSLAGSIIIDTKDPTWVPELLFETLADTDDLRSAAFAVSGPVLEDQVAVRLSGQVFRDEKDINYTDPDLAALGEDEFEEFRGKVLIAPTELPGFTGLFSASYTHDKPAWGLVTGPDYSQRVYDDPEFSAAEFRDTTVARYVSDLSYEITPEWTARSISSLIDTQVDIDSPTASTFQRDDVRDGLDLSQDVRVTYDPAEGPLSGVFGLFAGRFTTDIQSDIAILSGVVPFQQLEAENKTESVAIYADTRYRFLDRWTAIAGGRLLRDEVSADYAGSLLNLADFSYVPLDEDGSVSNVEFLPKLGLAFDLTDDQTIAVTASRGYRPGFSELVIGTTQINEVEPESLWSYELAYRSNWMEDRLQFIANTFYYDYRDQQIPVAFDPRFPFQTITVNAGESHSYGAELEARWLPNERFEFFAGVGLLKTKFDEGTFNGNDLAGNEFPEAPAVTASLGGIYRHASGFLAGADISHTDGFYSKGDIANTPALEVDSFTLVNAQVGYEYGNLAFKAFAKNLFDEDYLTGVSQGGSFAAIGDGRSFGVQLSGRF